MLTWIDTNRTHTEISQKSFILSHENWVKCFHVCVHLFNVCYRHIFSLIQTRCKQFHYSLISCTISTKAPGNISILGRIINPLVQRLCLMREVFQLAKGIKMRISGYCIFNNKVITNKKSWNVLTFIVKNRIFKAFLFSWLAGQMKMHYLLLA